MNTFTHIPSPSTFLADRADGIAHRLMQVSCAMEDMRATGGDVEGNAAYQVLQIARTTLQADFRAAQAEANEWAVRA